MSTAGDARPKRPPAPRRAGRRVLPAVLLIVLCVAAFARTTGHGFLFWDDRAFIPENRLIAHPSAGSLLALWTQPLVDLYAPLTYTLWALLSALVGQPAPWLFHLTNVALHALNACLVFALLRDLPGEADVGAALAGALVFALHPIQVETVAWASETKDLLAGLLSLVAIRQYLAFRARESRGAYVLASLAFGGALLSKPSAVVTPLLVLVLDRTLWRRRWRDALVAMGPWLVVAAMFTVIAAHAQPPKHTVAPIWLRPLVALDALGFYGLKVLLPLQLAPDYGRTAERSWATGVLIWSWIPAAVTLVTAWLLRRRLPALAAAVGLFCVSLLPVLGFVPFDFQYFSTVADHYVYLAMLGPAVGVTFACRQLPATARTIAVASAVTVLFVLSFRQAAHWKDDATVAARTLAVNPRSFMAHNNLGQLLEERGRLDEALTHYRAALEANPRDGDVLNNVGNVLFKAGRYDEAIRHYTGLLSAESPRTKIAARMHNNLGAAYLKTGRYDEAMTEFRGAIEIDPEYIEPYYNLGLVLTAFRRIDEAVRVLRDGLAIYPDHPALRQQLAIAMAGAAPLGSSVPR
jgi:protein O-mannosyl-transferase